MYSRGAAVAIVVFDLTNRESFADVDTWIRQAQSDKISQHRIVVAANKSDLEPEIPQTEIDKWATDRELTLIYVSAMSGENIQVLFQTVISRLPSAIESFRGSDDLHLEKNNQRSECCQN
jgi:GTPase SAR1 family protein